MENVMGSSLEMLKKRLLDPIFGSYTLFLIFANWRILLHVFSGEDVSTKISKIEEALNTPLFDVPIMLELFASPFLFPVFLTTIYLLLSGVLIPVYKKIELLRVLRENTRTNANLKLESIDSQIAHWQNLYSDEFNRRAKSDELAQARETTISSQEKTIKGLEEKVRDFESTVQSTNKKSTNDQLASGLDGFESPIEEYAIKNNLSSDRALELYNEKSHQVLLKLQEFLPKSATIRKARDAFESYLVSGSLVQVRHAAQILRGDWGDSSLGAQVKKSRAQLLMLLDSIQLFHS